MNEDELKKLNERLDSIELMLLALLDDLSRGSQAVAGSKLVKAQRLRQLLFNFKGW